jgi:hypothetical protein
MLRRQWLLLCRSTHAASSASGATCCPTTCRWVGRWAVCMTVA